MRTSLWHDRRGEITENEIASLLIPHFGHEIRIDYNFQGEQHKRYAELYCDDCSESLLFDAKEK